MGGGIIKGFSIAIIVVIFLSLIILPFMEMVNVFVHKLELNTAVFNAIRSAASRSVNADDKSVLDVHMDEETFYKRFAESFSTALKLNETYPSDNMVFTPKGECVFNDIDVNISITSDYDVDSDGNPIVSLSTIKVEAQTYYSYKTGYLRLMNETVTVNTPINVDQVYLLNIIN